nr:DUF1269 domain-containing protein [Actinomycetales bacterium]
MSELIIIGYDDHETAERAYNRVLTLQGDFVVDLTGLATVRVDLDGKKHVDTPGSVVGATAASGATWGLIVGLLFLNPGLGLLIGGAWGAIIGRLGKSGLNQGFRARVQGLLEPGKAAVVVMARKVTEDKFSRAMGEFGGTVLQTSLSDADERELQGMLGVVDESSAS